LLQGAKDLFLQATAAGHHPGAYYRYWSGGRISPIASNAPVVSCHNSGVVSEFEITDDGVSFGGKANARRNSFGSRGISSRIEVKVIMSKNAITVEQLKLECRHVKEMVEAQVTENLAIRTLELFADVWAKLHMGGSATPHHVDQVKLWSVEALKVRASVAHAPPKDHLRVEHGTPRRQFARLVLALYDQGRLTDANMALLVERYWKLAVITLEEDKRLNSICRSRMFDTPEERWQTANIHFPPSQC
jgi:hypothetical protein